MMLNTRQRAERACLIKHGTTMWCHRELDWWDPVLEKYQSALFVADRWSQQAGSIDSVTCYECLEFIMAAGETAATRYAELEIVHAHSPA